MQSAGEGMYGIGHRSVLNTDDPIISPRHLTMSRQNSSHLPSTSTARPISPPLFVRASSDDSSSYSSFHSSHPSPGMGSKGVDLFVFHLPVSVSEEELQQLFALYGPVLNVAVMRDRRTGEHKGFGFVTMQNVADAENAVKYLTGYALGSKYLKVSFKTNKSHQHSHHSHY
jgi:cold-inducible RNA-binding protein